MMHFSLFGMSLGWGRGAWVGLVVGLVVGALALGGVGNAVYAENPTCLTTTPDPSSRSIPENTPAGVNIGDPISATDADEGTEEYGDTLTYSLGPSADTADARAEASAFDIDASTGQLITKAPLNYEPGEANRSYSVTVTVKDVSHRHVAVEHGT